jgi:hypothetical protein
MSEPTTVAWTIEIFLREVPSDSEWVTREPTGYGEGRCACGMSTTFNGQHSPASEIHARLLHHITTDHPDWPADALEPLRRP